MNDSDLITNYVETHELSWGGCGFILEYTKYPTSVDFLDYGGLFNPLSDGVLLLGIF